jgi:hypothetical protein
MNTSTTQPSLVAARLRRRIADLSRELRYLADQLAQARPKARAIIATSKSAALAERARYELGALEDEYAGCQSRLAELEAELATLSIEAE